MRSWAALTSARVIIDQVAAFYRERRKSSQVVAGCRGKRGLREMALDPSGAYPVMSRPVAPVEIGSCAFCQASSPPVTFITFFNPARCKRLQAIMLRYPLWQ